MNTMKVCKLVRLTKKNEKGEFVNGKDGVIPVRKRAVVSKETVEETQENYHLTGLLYIIDEKATAERDAIVEAEQAGADAQVEDEDEDKKPAPPAGAKL